MNAKSMRVRSGGALAQLGISRRRGRPAGKDPARFFLLGIS